jgi:hypothetical protein
MKYIAVPAFTTMLLLATLSNPADAQQACDRTCLTGHMDSYLNGLLGNTTAGIQLARDVKITNNNTPGSLVDTFWDSADSVNYRFDIANPVLGDIASESVIGNTDGTLTMLMVRLKVLDQAITEVEIIKAN